MGDDTEPSKNRFDRAEWSGAFGDLGTLVPFVLAYISVVRMEPGGILFGFGSAMIVVGLFCRTPFPVQPMKAVGVAVLSPAAAGIGAQAVVGAGLVTGLIWMFLGLTGLAQRIAAWIPRPALLGVIMGLGFSFMLEGARQMAESPWLGATVLALTLILLSRPKVPAMLVILALGFAIAWWRDPALGPALAGMRPVFVLPGFAWPALDWNAVWIGMVVLALPQVPLTFGNALIAITEENNRLFPDRPVTERGVALSTGFLNLWSSAFGGVPMCHGAGGMAGHVQFGARTGGASIILGAILLVLGLFFAHAVETLFRAVPPAVLGVILFLAGAQLALGSRELGSEKAARFVILTTAALTMLHVGVAVLYGIAVHLASKRGWLRM